MPPLIAREQALRSGDLEDHDAIVELVDRAWAAHREKRDFEKVLEGADNGADPRPDGAPNRWPGEQPAKLSGLPFGH